MDDTDDYDDDSGDEYEDDYDDDGDGDGDDDDNDDYDDDYAHYAAKGRLDLILPLQIESRHWLTKPIILLHVLDKAAACTSFLHHFYI